MYFDGIFGVYAESGFQRLQKSFLDRYYQEFDETEENKFCYTDIHREYVRNFSIFLYPLKDLHNSNKKEGWGAKNISFLRKEKKIRKTKSVLFNIVISQVHILIIMFF